MPLNRAPHRPRAAQQQPTHQDQHQRDHYDRGRQAGLVLVEIGPVVRGERRRLERKTAVLLDVARPGGVEQRAGQPLGRSGDEKPPGGGGGIVGLELQRRAAEHRLEQAV